GLPVVASEAGGLVARRPRHLAGLHALDHPARRQNSRIASDLDFLGTNDPPFRLGRIGEALRSCLSRFARAGLVTLRQTFVRRYHGGWQPSWRRRFNRR